MPTLYVSHAVDEVTALCSHTIVLDEGRVRASGPTEDVLERRDLDELLGDVDASSLVHATALEHDAKYGLTQLKVEDSEWSVPMHIDLEKGEHTHLADTCTRRSSSKRTNLTKSVFATFCREESSKSRLRKMVLQPTASCKTAKRDYVLESRVHRSMNCSFRLVTSVYALIKSVTLG